LLEHFNNQAGGGSVNIIFIESNLFVFDRTNYEKIEPHSSLPGPEAHIVKDGEKQPPNR